MDKWTPVGADYYIVPATVERVYANQQYIASRIAELIGMYNLLAVVDMSRGSNEFGTIRLINKIENNLRNEILSIYSYKPDDYVTKIWRGAGLDNPKLNFNDVNRWFYILEELNISLDNIYENFRYCGNELISGEDDYDI